MPYPKLLKNSAGEDEMVMSTEDEANARADGFVIEVPAEAGPGKVVPFPAGSASGPVKILPAIRAVNFSVGSSAGHRHPEIRTRSLMWHQTVVDILEGLNVLADGSWVMLKPGTAYPFQMEERPYALITEGFVLPDEIGVLEGITLSIVPNTVSHVGPGGIPSKPLPPSPAEVAARAPVPPVIPPYAPEPPAPPAAEKEPTLAQHAHVRHPGDLGSSVSGDQGKTGIRGLWARLHDWWRNRHARHSLAGGVDGNGTHALLW